MKIGLGGQCLKMIDLWLLFVEYVFGGFYFAIFGLSAIFLVILMLGGVSIFTALWFVGIFLFAMFLGNGTWIVVLPISAIIIFQFIRGITTFIDAYYRGGQ